MGSITLGDSNITFAFRGNTELPTKAVQNFAFSAVDGNYIYTTQRENSNTYLSRYKRSSNPFYADWLSYEELSGYGHGETLEVTSTSNVNKEFVWVGSMANTESTKGWSTAIKRLYVKPSETSFTIEAEKELRYFKYATKDGSALNSNNVRRVIAGISKDETRICFKIHFPAAGTGDAIYYAVYDLAKLNSLLTAASSYISMKNATSAYITGFVGTSVPEFQAIDLAGGKEIYIGKGNLSDGVANIITKHVYTDNSTSIPNATGALSLNIASDISFGEPSSAEIEGVKCYGSYMYFTLNFNTARSGDSTGKANRTPLYLLGIHNVN